MWIHIRVDIGKKVRDKKVENKRAKECFHVIFTRLIGVTGVKFHSVTGVKFHSVTGVKFQRHGIRKKRNKGSTE